MATQNDPLNDTTGSCPEICEAEEAMPEAKAFVNHPTLYFEDGNVIIKCQNTLFRVHRSRLAENSTVLEELLTIQDGKPRERLRDCLFLALDDEKDYMEILIGSVYGGFRLDFPSVTTDKYPFLADLLRLATKYCIEVPRKAILEHLQEQTATLENIDAKFAALVTEEAQENKGDVVDTQDGEAVVGTLEGAVEKEGDTVDTPRVAPIPGFTSCQRCDDANKECTGVTGFACDQCRAIKQKCTNNSGKGRNKTKPAREQPQRVKRKSPPEPTPPQLSRGARAKAKVTELDVEDTEDSEADADGEEQDSDDGDEYVVTSQRYSSKGRPLKRPRVTYENEAGPSKKGRVSGGQKGLSKAEQLEEEIGQVLREVMTSSTRALSLFDQYKKLMRKQN